MKDKIEKITEKTYNCIWEQAVLLSVMNLLRLITVSISSAIPANEMQEVKRTIQGWINKLGEKFDTYIDDGTIR